MISSVSDFSFLVFLVFSITAAVQLFYYLYFFLAVIRYPHPEAESRGIPVSVIICARNEGENLREFLPAVLEQDYPCYEVIVVNDCSEDNSYLVLGEYLEKYPHLRVSSVNKDPKFTHNKKFAQFIGIKAAKNEILVFTDADCRPDSSKWLECVASNFSDKVDFVLGYGGYFPGKGLLNRYIRYDTMTIALQYLGMALRGFPYMGVGRNLAYRRSVFFENRGFGTHNHIISGDDDLFVNSNANGTNTKVEFRAGSHTRSYPRTNLSDWVSQKKRHFSTAPYYKFRDKFLLFLEPFSRMVFYVSFIILLTRLYLLHYLLIIFVVRLIIQITVLIIAKNRFIERGLVGFSLLFDIFSPVINGTVYLTSKKKSAKGLRWK